MCCDDEECCCDLCKCCAPLFRVCPNGSGVVPLVLVIALIVWIYSVFTIYALFPMATGTSQLYSDAAIFNLCVGLLWISLLRCLTEQRIFIKPAKDRKEMSEIPLAPEKVKETKWNGDRRFCRKCNQYKPDRAHHCSVCNMCVLKMDHHCNFINKCIGFWNYKFFILFLFWAVVSCGYVSVFLYNHSFHAAITRMLLDWHGFTDPASQICMVFLVAAVLTFVLGGFLVMHLYLIARNYTTIEHCEKRTSGDYIHIWSLGFLANMAEVFGGLGEWYVWLLPVLPREAKQTKGNYFRVLNAKRD